MPKASITNKFVSKITCNQAKAKEVYYDEKLSGFILEVRNTQTKTFYYSYSKNSRRTMRKIGSAEILSASEARKIILNLKKGQLSSDVASIMAEKSGALTLANFFTEYYLPYVQKHVKSHDTNESIFKNHILPTLGTTPMQSLKKIDVMKLHSEMMQKKRLKPATANKLLIFLSQAYRLAYEFELLKTPYNPVSGVKHFEENNERQRFLSKAETKRLLDAVLMSENVHLKYIIPMLLLSGARKGELLKAKFEDFDEVQMLWIIPTTKNGKKRIIPLTPELYKIYKQIPQESEYLFTSKATNKPYTTFYNSWNSARVKANLADVRIHDLRHTYASALVNAKRSLYEVQVLLGHSTAKMTQRYAHLSNESLYAAASCAARLF
ncbi:site-specific integrase [Sulfurimonas sp.]|jgi:integrase|uniref:site-specific integrase n=1 Tax=Sulfurimonas sp. TaxID=2022749 RepID=UPI0025EFA4ED|nr:site-specific integrase [Sulfurimonas sp.]MCK9473807.1 site-specific integrase [Sulfurimonas sp.]